MKDLASRREGTSGYLSPTPASRHYTQENLLHRHVAMELPLIQWTKLQSLPDEETPEMSWICERFGDGELPFLGHYLRRLIRMGKANIIIHIFAGPICWRASFWFDMVYCVCDTGDKKKRVMSAIHGWPAVISVVFPAKVYVSMTKRYKKFCQFLTRFKCFSTSNFWSIVSHFH